MEKAKAAPKTYKGLKDPSTVPPSTSLSPPRIASHSTSPHQLSKKNNTPVLLLLPNQTTIKMRFACPSTSSLTRSASEKSRSFARDSRRESLARIPEDGNNPGGVLASVVSSHRLRGQLTTAKLRAVASTPNMSAVPQKRVSTTHLMDDSEPFGKISFCEWYETLTLEKRRALMLSMIEVLKERRKSNGRGTSSNTVPTDPDQIAFQWRFEGDKEDLVLQFTKWYTALDETEQDTALAYSGITDGDKVADLPTEEEENTDKENEQVRKPVTRFVEGSSGRSTPRDADTDPKSTGVKGKARRLTREASAEVFNWAQSYTQNNPTAVVPAVAVTQSAQAGAAGAETTDPFQTRPLPSPKPPKRGHSAKRTRKGTLNDKGKPMLEKIPSDVVCPQKGTAPN
ncbi:hypothetical protein L218DRAFT_953662 [Marasmius fiardii PR-910]|nr:hypothetical protein L218DRAFT_953662 [Marasmius fiardii PR-910]